MLVARLSSTPLCVPPAFVHHRFFTVNSSGPSDHEVLGCLPALPFPAVSNSLFHDQSIDHLLRDFLVWLADKGFSPSRPPPCLFYNQTPPPHIHTQSSIFSSPTISQSSMVFLHPEHCTETTFIHIALTPLVLSRSSLVYSWSCLIAWGISSPRQPNSWFHAQFTWPPH